MPKTHRPAHLASLVPGRLRLKLHPLHRDQATLDGIKSDLQNCEGVRSVRINPDNGSLVMHYDEHRYNPKNIMGLLEDIDVLVESVGHLPELGEASKGEVENVGFLAAVEDLNHRIQSRTGLGVDLKWVLPGSFLGAGLWSIARRGLMIETVPGWLFLWFAFDMFVKLHPVRQKKTGGGG